MPALELTLAFGHIGPAMNQLDAEASTDRLQRHGAIRRAVIDDELTADAALEHRLFEHALDVEGALGEVSAAT